MTEILLAIKHPHIMDIHSGVKTNELRTRAPKIACPFKVYSLDTKSSGGSGKIVSEWICDDMETWRICVGVPQHLVTTGCVSVEDILKYTDNGKKDLTSMHISNLIIYDTPRELSEFYRECPEYAACKGCKWYFEGNYDEPPNCGCDGDKPLERAPQSWCYVKSI